MPLTPATPEISVTYVVDEVAHLSTAFAAYEVLEQLISPTRDNSQEDLSHISREGLGQLLSLVNSAMRQRIANTELAANTAYAINCASDLAPARAQ
jgi:hypothetical protein